MRTSRYAKERTRTTTEQMKLERNISLYVGKREKQGTG